MSFKDTLLQIGATKLLPDRLLGDLIAIQQQDQLEDAIGLLLSEILFPGSQKLSSNPTNPITSLTPTSIPEATARGAQMFILLSKLKTQPNWTKVFSIVLSNYSSAAPITVASLSQFLSSLGTEPIIDLFLTSACKTSNSLLLKDLLIQLNALEPSSGAIDLFELKLDPILSTESNSRHILLYYKSIVKIEVKTIALLQNENINDPTTSAIFSRDYRAAPEYIVLACLYILHDEPEAKENDVVVNIMQNFVVSLLDVSSPYLSAIFTKFEEFNAVELAKLLVKYYDVRKSTDSIHKIASLTASFKKDTVIMSILNNASDFPDSFSFAIIFSQYGWKRFQEFVLTQLDRNINVVAGTIIEFMENQASIEYESAQEGHRLTKSLNLETVYFLMTTLSSKQLPPDLFEKFRNLQALCLQAYPRLINFGQGYDSAILMNSSTNTFSVDVEKEMKVYYQKMYNKEIEIKDIVNMLQRLKVSNNPHDQDVFACMIHSLLDEYRFFPEYPVDALATTSVLFGNTIFFRLVEGPALSIALRYIIDSARQPPESKMFKFAIQALYSFMKRLNEFPKFCAMLCEIRSLQSQPQLYETCKAIASGNGPPVASPQTTTNGLTSSSKQVDGDQSHTELSYVASKFFSVEVPQSILRDVPQEALNDEISDRVLFMVNNITEDNVASRTDELKELLAPKYFRWFSNYLVSQRAKLEPNYHNLYGEIVARFDSRLFDAHIQQVTLYQIVTLLNKAYEAGTEDDAADVLTSTERTHLKNLGAWLGRITFPRNQPIQHKHVSFKDLLVEAYDHKRLEIIIPFVCKVLDQTKSSKVFEYPNPWLLGILQVLKELYEVANLKLNLKFELEVLCNSLNVELERIDASNIIRDHKPGEKESFIESQKMIVNIAKLSLDEKRAQQQLNVLQQLQQQRLLATAHQQPHDATNMYDSSAVNSNLPINQLGNVQQQQPVQPGIGFENLNGTSIFVTHPNLKRLFQLAITKAVREILPPVVNRTNSVALITTKSLILKDFALEVDELKLRKAYINTVRHLSESLTHASCRDLLRDNIQLNLHQYLQSLNQSVDTAILDDLPRAINDNLDLACSIIQKAAMEKSVQDLDELMLPSIALRRQFRESRPDQTFCDTQYASRYAMSLPEPLGIKPGGVSQKQFSIYDEFGRHRATGDQFSNATDVANGVSAVAGGGITPPPVNAGVDQEALAQRVLQQQSNPQSAAIAPESIEQSRAALDQSFIYIQQLMEALLKSIAETKQNEIHLREISMDHPSRNYLAEIIQVLSRMGNQDTYMKFAHLAMNALFRTETPSQLLIEALVFLLDKTCEMSPYAAKFVTTWLITADDERKYNKKIMSSLVMVGMVSLNDLDLSISKSIEAKKDEKVIDFACSLILDMILSEQPIALRADFINVVSVLKTLSPEEQDANPKVKEVFDLLDKSANLPIENLKSLSVDPSKMKDYFAYVFSEWVKLYKFGDNNKALQIQFINQLFDTGVLTKPDLLVVFLTTAMEMSVLSFIKEGANLKKTYVDSYTSVDALANLVIQLILIQEDASSNNTSRSQFFKSILSVILLSFAHDHETNKANFNERPYFRFFSTLLSDWCSIDQSDFEGIADKESEVTKLKHFSGQMYHILSDFLLALQPAAFPGFTFAWMCLISHRMFLPNLLEDKAGSWNKLAALLVALLKFQSGYIKESSIPEAITVVYKGTLRIFLVILHDYPEFLADNANLFVNYMSPSFVQLRNIVLSASPKDMNIPDPFQPGLKVDRLPEIAIAPVISSPPSQILLEKNIKKAVDNYMRIPSNSLLRQIVASFELSEPTAEAGIGYGETKYNTKLINSLVLHVGMTAIDERPKNSLVFNHKSSQVTLLTSIMQEGVVELQFHVLQAIANNLRYPNSHTHWFSCLILHYFGSNSLWGEDKLDVQQLIIRVLLERTICNKPHPWGLLITFTELLKNSEYSFFDLPFTKGAVEFERLFSSLLTHIKNSSGVTAN
ncbi:hypothetical protein CANARDRAFT_199241 [[Candida] arabinofermentans NRRL YB-2248]|uniref:General negative regulator of transcription subunit 1 n=1 Tax=[Candida] arabinofermentans NRRL YB-2248 TaxID=983967 RepID=A0A1E4T040_9ASCO|nr:hypothetical protein CANARDRAFT_199241 [[Candida] arabinofermentans NRRL YB-2248]